MKATGSHNGIHRIPSKTDCFCTNKSYKPNGSHNGIHWIPFVLQEVLHETQGLSATPVCYYNTIIRVGWPLGGPGKGVILVFRADGSRILGGARGIRPFASNLLRPPPTHPTPPHPLPLSSSDILGAHKLARAKMATS